MDVKTGKIEEFEDEAELKKAQETGKWVELGKRPNPGCKHCHGHGFTGRDVATNEYILCKCVKKRPTRKQGVE